MGVTLKVLRRGTHRSASLDDTLKRALPLAPVMGITRVANVTGLDSVGIPVVMVCRPTRFVRQAVGPSLRDFLLPLQNKSNKEVWMKIAKLAHRHHESRQNAWMVSTKMLKTACAMLAN